LQESLFPPSQSSSKYTTLSSIGISTNPKTGELQMDDTKVRAALSEDYEGVAQLFVRGRFGDGIGERVSNKIKAYRDPQVGVIRSRMRGLDNVIENQDKDIARRERQLEDKEVSIRRRFSALEGQMGNLQAQGNFLSARFGGGGGGQEGGGGGG
jgi:flagellar hook-associated protein 2